MQSHVFLSESDFIQAKRLRRRNWKEEAHEPRNAVMR